MNDKRLITFQLFCVALVVAALLLAFWAASTAHAAGAQVPYVCGVSAGVISLCVPGVPGYNSGYVVVMNANTRERQALYFNWQPDHPLDMGLFKTSGSQIVRMGSGIYLIEYCQLGIQECWIPDQWEVFSLRVWQSWLAAMR